jgi:hypothetical protein
MQGFMPGFGGFQFQGFQGVQGFNGKLFGFSGGPAY